MIQCAMTGRPMHTEDGIYDDGEWISWDWINGQLYEQDVKQQYPEVDPQLAMLFEDLVESAHSYHAMTGRYLQIWGELGELYAEVKYGIQRHKPHIQGSDGKLGKDFVEIKTISPGKNRRPGPGQVSRQFQQVARHQDRRTIRIRGPLDRPQAAG